MEVKSGPDGDVMGKGAERIDDGLLGEMDRVVEVHRDGEAFVLSDGCDQWFHAILTREEMRALGEQMIALAGAEQKDET